MATEETQGPTEGVKSAWPKSIFIISQIGESGSEERRKADYFRDFIVKKAVKPLGIRCERADELSKSGIITDQIVEHLMDDDLIVADLTGLNANVFYELAIRHAARKPFIHTFEVGTQIPFDIKGNRAIPYDLSDLRSVYEAQEELVRQILSIDPVKPPRSPFSFYVDSKALAAQSSDPEALVGQALLRIESMLRTSSPQNYRPDLQQQIGLAEAGTLMGAATTRWNEARDRLMREGSSALTDTYREWFEANHRLDEVLLRNLNSGIRMIDPRSPLTP